MARKSPEGRNTHAMGHDPWTASAGGNSPLPKRIHGQSTVIGRRLLPRINPVMDVTTPHQSASENPRRHERTHGRRARWALACRPGQAAAGGTWLRSKAYLLSPPSLHSRCECESVTPAAPPPSRCRSGPRSAEKPPPDHAPMPRHAHHDPAPPACCSCCCGCAVAAPCYYPAPAPAPPSSAASDQLLHAIAAHLLLSSPAPAQPQPQPQPQPPPPPAAQHATNPYPYPYPHPQQYQYQYQQQEAKPHGYTHPPPPQQLKPNPSGDHGHLLLHSLLRRVAAIESALPRCFPAPPPARRPPHPNSRPRRAARYQEEEEEQEVEEGDESEPESPPSPPRPRRPARTGPPPSAASDRAARTIQVHFRRFLARRSRTLRQLKEIAVLRSKAAAIRGSLSGRRGGADPAAVSEAAMGLLLRIDAIQVMEPLP